MLKSFILTIIFCLPFSSHAQFDGKKLGDIDNSKWLLKSPAAAWGFTSEITGRFNKDLEFNGDFRHLKYEHDKSDKKANPVHFSPVYFENDICRIYSYVKPSEETSVKEGDVYTVMEYNIYNDYKGRGIYIKLTNNWLPQLKTVRINCEGFFSKRTPLHVISTLLDYVITFE